MIPSPTILMGQLWPLVIKLNTHHGEKLPRIKLTWSLHMHTTGENDVKAWGLYEKKIEL